MLSLKQHRLCIGVSEHFGLWHTDRLLRIHPCSTHQCESSPPCVFRCTPTSDTVFAALSLESTTRSCCCTFYNNTSEVRQQGRSEVFPLLPLLLSVYPPRLALFSPPYVTERRSDTPVANGHSVLWTGRVTSPLFLPCALPPASLFQPERWTKTRTHRKQIFTGRGPLTHPFPHLCSPDGFCQMSLCHLPLTTTAAATCFLWAGGRNGIRVQIRNGFFTHPQTWASTLIMHMCKMHYST